MNSPLFGALGLEWVRFEHCQNNVPIQAQKMVMVKGSRSRTMYVFLFYFLLHFRSLLFAQIEEQILKNTHKPYNVLCP